MQIFDTTPHRRLRRPRGASRTPIEFEVSFPTVTAGGLATLIALATMMALTVPLTGQGRRIAAEWPGAFVRVLVPVAPGSRWVEDLYLPSLSLMILPVAGAFVAALGFAASRKKGLPLAPAVGMVACAVAMACWCLYPLWMSLAHGLHDVPGP